MNAKLTAGSKMVSIRVETFNGLFRTIEVPADKVPVQATAWNYSHISTKRRATK